MSDERKYIIWSDAAGSYVKSVRIGAVSGKLRPESFGASAGDAFSFDFDTANEIIENDPSWNMKKEVFDEVQPRDHVMYVSDAEKSDEYRMVGCITGRIESKEKPSSTDDAEYVKYVIWSDALESYIKIPGDSSKCPDDKPHVFTTDITQAHIFTQEDAEAILVNPHVRPSYYELSKVRIKAANELKPMPQLDHPVAFEPESPEVEPAEQLEYVLWSDAHRAYVKAIGYDDNHRPHQLTTKLIYARYYTEIEANILLEQPIAKSWKLSKIELDSIPSGPVDEPITVLRRKINQLRDVLAMIVREGKALEQQRCLVGTPVGWYTAAARALGDEISMEVTSAPRGQNEDTNSQRSDRLLDAAWAQLNSANDTLTECQTQLRLARTQRDLAREALKAANLKVDILGNSLSAIKTVMEGPFMTQLLEATGVDYEGGED